MTRSNIQFPGLFGGGSDSMRLSRVPYIWMLHKFPGGTHNWASLFNTDLDSKHQLKLPCGSLEQRLEIIFLKSKKPHKSLLPPEHWASSLHRPTTELLLETIALRSSISWVQRGGLRSQVGRSLKTLLHYTWAVSRQAPHPRHKVDDGHAFFLDSPSRQPRGWNFISTTRQLGRNSSGSVLSGLGSDKKKNSKPHSQISRTWASY